jgi:hypothetical protein
MMSVEMSWNNLLWFVRDFYYFWRHGWSLSNSYLCAQGSGAYRKLLSLRYINDNLSWDEQDQARMEASEWEGMICSST